MHLRLRLATSVALIALVVAACGGSTASPSASPAASTGPTTAPAASQSAAPVTSAAPAQSAAPADSAAPSASTGATASATPAPTPTPDQAALMALLPTKVGAIEFAPFVIDTAKLVAASQAGDKGLPKFLDSIGVKPTDFLAVFDRPTSNTPVGTSIGAYRFKGADPATLKEKFIASNLSQTPQLTQSEQNVGGKTVIALTAPASNGQPPIYLIFRGDTVFIASATDQTVATEAVKALP